jgi:hypothetical protein
MEESSCSKLLTTSLVTSPSTPSHPSDGNNKIPNEIISPTTSPPTNDNNDDANDECSDDEYYFIGDVYIDQHSPLTPSCSAVVSTSVAAAAAPFTMTAPFATTSKVEQQVQQVLPTRKIAAAAKTAAVVGELLRGYEATPPPSSSTSTTLIKSKSSKRRRSLRLQEKPTQLLLRSNNSISSSDDDNQQELITLVQQIYNQPYSWCFRQPVDNSIVPDYCTVITHPIDLSTIMTRITTPSSFGNTNDNDNKTLYNKYNLYNDLQLMIHNCKLEFLAPLTAFFIS